MRLFGKHASYGACISSANNLGYIMSNANTYYAIPIHICTPRKHRRAYLNYQIIRVAEIISISGQCEQQKLVSQSEACIG